MKKTETSEYLPYQLQNGENVRLSFAPTMKASIRATKSTSTSVFYDLDIWPVVEDIVKHTRLYNVDSAFVELFDPATQGETPTSLFDSFANLTRP